MYLLKITSPRYDPRSHPVCSCAGRQQTEAAISVTERLEWGVLGAVVLPQPRQAMVHLLGYGVEDVSKLIAQDQRGNQQHEGHEAEVGPGAILCDGTYVVAGTGSVCVCRSGVVASEVRMWLMWCTEAHVAAVAGSECG